MNCPACGQIVTAEQGSKPTMHDDGYPPEVYCSDCGWPDNMEEDSEHSTTMDEALRMYSEWFDGIRSSHY